MRQTKLERDYQAYLIKELYELFPGCLVLKNDSGYLQGIPDLTLLWGPYWALLEVKPRCDAPEEPNQRWYIETMGQQSFTAFIYPENEEEVLRELQLAFSARRTSRVSQR